MASKTLKIAFISTLLLSSTQFVTPHISAEKSINQQIQEAQNKQRGLKQEKTGLNQNLQQKKQSIASVQMDQKTIGEEIRKLDTAVEESLTKISSKEQEITDTKVAIEQLNKDIAELKAQIAKRDELLKNRVRSVQQNGGAINYLDVLLGAASFSDFLSRMGAVSIIVKQDKEILDKHVKEQKELETKKVEVTQMLTSLEQQKQDLETMKTKLEDQRKQKDQMLAQLKVKEQNIEGEMVAIEEEMQILAKQEQMMRKLVDQLKVKEQQRIAAAKKGEKPPKSDGTFMRPSVGTVTSEFGARWGKFHEGIDIAKSGEVPIVAAADGIVFRSYYSTSYGNVVFITHNVDGQVFTTVYAHMRSRNVSEGDVVTKGQRVGYMGNTGFSFGQHTHFELHKGSWNMEKTNAVNPRDYINF